MKIAALVAEYDLTHFNSRQLFLVWSRYLRLTTLDIISFLLLLFFLSLISLPTKTKTKTDGTAWYFGVLLSPSALLIGFALARADVL